MAIDIPVEFIAFLGIFIGVFARTYFPYKQAQDTARAAGEAIKFDFRYIFTAFFSVLISSALVFSTFVIPEVGSFQIFIAALIFAYGTTSIMNRYAAQTESGTTPVAPLVLTKIESDVSPASDLQFRKPE